jgi:ABC-type multidrug transport system fused ATPase/permease subunit
MVHLKRSQVRFIEETMALPNGFGYVLDFSDRTISEFFEDEFAIDFDDAKYSVNGTSKRNRLTTLISLEDSYTVAKVLRALWERREGLLVLRGDVDNLADSGQMKAEFLEINGLVKKYGDRVAVRGVSFCVHEGEIFGLLGPNGAGISILATLFPHDGGQVTMAGYDLVRETTRTPFSKTSPASPFTASSGS